jgi:hypothetical protein
MLGNLHFYNRSIRKTIVAFGTLFNDIELVRFDNDDNPKERFKVPLSYGPKEKYITRVTSDPTLTKSVLAVVPRMAFNLDSITYDATRKQITTTRNFAMGSTGLNAQYAPVPFDFIFSLSIFVRNTEDGTQILEQILPFFTPDYTMTIDYIGDMTQHYDTAVVLDSVHSTVDYEGDMTTTRLIIWDLTFTAKSFIWPPVKNLGDKLIKRANTNITTQNTGNTVPVVRMWSEVDPFNANPDDMYGFRDIIIENTGDDV